MRTVTEAARLAGTTPHAVRYYDKLGLLGDLARDESGARLLSDDDVEWLRLITLLRAAGQSLDEVACFAELRRQGPPTAAERERILRRCSASLREKADALDCCAVLL